MNVCLTGSADYRIGIAIFAEIVVGTQILQPWSSSVPIPDFLPQKDADLLAWTAVFSAGIAAEAESLGVLGAYAKVRAGYAAALTLASDPSTRTTSTDSSKNDARAALKRLTRRLAAVVRANSAVSDAQRLNLGLRPRRVLSPIRRPGRAPDVVISESNGRRFTVRIRPADSNRRGMPAKVSHAIVMSYIGGATTLAPPADFRRWHLHHHATRAIVQIDFGIEAAPGTRIWLAAAYVSPRGHWGPMSVPVSAYIAGAIGPVMTMAA